MYSLAIVFGCGGPVCVCIFFKEKKKFSNKKGHNDVLNYNLNKGLENIY